MRHPSEVAKQMAEIIEDPKHKERLLKLAEDFFYKSPEQFPDCFEMLSWYLFEKIILDAAHLIYPLQFELIAIFCDKTVDEIKEINESFQEETFSMVYD